MKASRLGEAESTKVTIWKSRIENCVFDSTIPWVQQNGHCYNLLYYIVILILTIWHTICLEV